MIAVTLSLTLSIASARRTAPLNSPLVFITGILTLTFFPHDAMTRPCLIIVGKYLERDWMLGDFFQYYTSEHLIIRDARLAHKRRVCRKPGDERIFFHLENALQVGTVSKNLYLQIFYAWHGEAPSLQSLIMKNNFRRFGN